MFTDGFGFADQRTLMALKAALDETNGGLKAGHDVAPGLNATASGSPLIPQSLEGTLAVATANEKHVRFFNAIPRPAEPLRATIHEYTRMTGLGYELEPFIGEGAVPTEHTSAFVREFVKVRYLATLRRVTDPMAAVTTIGGTDAIGRESLNGTVHILLQLEKSLFFGDSRVNDYAFDGVFSRIQQSYTDNHFDLKGQPMTVEYAQHVLADFISAPRYAAPEAIWLAPEAQVAMSNLQAQQLFYVAAAANAGMMQPNAGFILNAVNGPLGAVKLEPSIFLRAVELFKSDGGYTAVGTAPTYTFDNGYPIITIDAAATIGSNQAPNIGSSLSRFEDGDDGTYYYCAVVVGSQGKSAPIKLQMSDGQGGFTDAIPVGVADKVKIAFKWTSVPSDVINIEIYRTPKDTAPTWNGATLTSGRFYKVATIRKGTTTEVFYCIDTNIDRAGTSKALIVQYDPSIIQFRKLMDLIRVPLAKVDLSTRFAIVLFGTLVLETPTKVGCIYNVGASS